MFDHILNWKLQSGSHAFPGPAGGTCINEAAIVAAGFEYRKVESASDCPPCFCPVLSQFAIAVNDCLDDKPRNELLMPLIVRLAGSNDWSAMRKRTVFIIDQIDERLMKPLARICGVQQLYGDDGRMGHLAAVQMRSARDQLERGGLAPARFALTLAIKVLANLSNIGSNYQARFVPRQELSALMEAPMRGPVMATATIDYEVANFRPREVWIIAAGILTDAFDIGKQAPALDTAMIVERMDAAKAKAPAPQLTDA